MHAVVVKVNIQDAGPAEEYLKAEVVPRVSQAPGFVAGYWSRSDDGSNGLSMLVFESEEAARAISGQVVPPDEAPVTVEDVEVREVVASA